MPELEDDPLWYLLFGDAPSHLAWLSQTSSRLVHYTSAENAINIIKGKEVWLRNTRAMNDFSEIEHGLNLMSKILNRNFGTKRELWTKLEEIIPGLSIEVVEKLDAWASIIPDSTYAFSLSEHGPKENELGRLSMWRAYSNGGTGVALVINPSAFLSDVKTDGFGVMSTKINYARDVEFESDMESFFNNARMVAGDLRLRGIGAAAWTLTFALIMRALSIKHPGFEEEHEWRVILNDRLFRKPVCKQEVECIRGVPQLVYKLPLISYSEFGVSGLTPNELLDRVIIGPSEHANLISAAIIKALEDSGVTDPKDRVSSSNIPLR